jgi:hypothetical protein
MWGPTIIGTGTYAKPRGGQVTDRVKPTWQASGILEIGVFAELAEVALAWTVFDTQIQEVPAVSHPRVRFTVRRLMLVILFVAALLTAFEAGRRWERAGRAAPDPFDPVEMATR